jgi:adenylate kinase family enzyme
MGKFLKFKRIHIFGGPASGKSTLARKLSAKLGLPYVELDAFFWDDDSEHYDIRRDPEKRDALLAEAAAKEAWVSEGVYWKWCDAAFERAELILVLDLPLWLRQVRLWRRHLLRRLGIEKSLEKDTLLGTLTTARWNRRWDRDNLSLAMEKLGLYRSKLQFGRRYEDFRLK